MTTKNLQVLLAARPNGPVNASHFSLVEAAIPTPGPGEVLVRNHWLSLDPYMRGRMDATKSYAPCVELGEVMTGRTVGEVVESQHPRWRVGDKVVGMTGWQLYGVAPGETFSRVVPNLPLSTNLGVVGMPGVTAWIGLFEHCAPRAGETVVVSAAAGAVGSVAGQLAKMHGCRVVGIAGGPDKCAHVVNTYGFDECIDYKAGSLAERLKEACPQGIDCSFENVGGPTMDTVLGLLNPFARVALCGMISDYNVAQPHASTMLRSLLVNRVKLQGFIVSDRMDLYQRALPALARLVIEKKLKYTETVAVGLENASAAFMGLLAGKNRGKQLVKLVDDNG